MKINWKRWKHCFCIRRAEFFNVCNKMMIYNSAVKKIYRLTNTLVRFRSGQGFPDHTLLLSKSVDSSKPYLWFTARSLNGVYFCLNETSGQKQEGCRVEPAAKALACCVRDQDAEPKLTQASGKVEFQCVTCRQRTLSQYHSGILLRIWSEKAQRPICSLHAQTEGFLNPSRSQRMEKQSLVWCSYAETEQNPKETADLLVQ